MGARARIAAAGGIGTAAAVLVASVALSVREAPVPTAGRALHSFADCAAVRDWYVARTVDDVGPYGWGGQVVPLRTSPTAFSRTGPVGGAGAVAEFAGRGPSPTGTNTEEASVDEPDVAKTDGRTVFRVVGSRLLLDDVTGTAPHRLATTALPRSVVGPELLLVGRRLVVLGAQQRTLAGQVTAPGSDTRVLDYDVEDPSAPRLVSDRTLSGELLGARQYGDVVRVVTSTGRPALPFVQPGPDVSRAEAVRHNRALVRATTAAEWLPSVRDDRTGLRRPLVGCGDVLHAARDTGGSTDTLAVTGFDARTPATTDSAGLTGTGDLVYSSASMLFVAGARVVGRPGGPRPMVGGLAPARADGTDVHTFALHATGSSYVASGHVAGTVRDQWSMDEQDGLLRLALTWAGRDGLPRDNGVAVLAPRDGRLVTVATARGLGRRESLESVRWFPGLAVLVTFRQTDPLYTVDLDDPEHPRALGALHLPGFSGYLHPIELRRPSWFRGSQARTSTSGRRGEDGLLGLGSRVDRTGRELGAQAAVFDIGVPAHPVRLDRTDLGASTSTTAATDAHAFSWLPTVRTAITGVLRTLPDGRTRTVVHALTVGTDGRLTDRVLARTRGWLVRALPLPGGRVVLVTPSLRLLTVPR